MVHRLCRWPTNVLRRRVCAAGIFERTFGVSLQTPDRQKVLQRQTFAAPDISPMLREGVARFEACFGVNRAPRCGRWRLNKSRW